MILAYMQKILPSENIDFLLHFLKNHLTKF